LYFKGYKKVCNLYFILICNIIVVEKMKNSLKKTNFKFLKLYIILNKIFKILEKITIKKNFKNKRKIKNTSKLLKKFKITYQNLYNIHVVDYSLKWKILFSYYKLFGMQKCRTFFSNIKNYIILFSKLTNLQFRINNSKNISGFIQIFRKKTYRSFLIYRDILNKKQLEKEFLKLIDVLFNIK